MQFEQYCYGRREELKTVHVGNWEKSKIKENLRYFVFQDQEELEAFLFENLRNSEIFSLKIWEVLKDFPSKLKKVWDFLSE